MDNPKIEVTKLVDHLFRHETGKLTSVLTRIFGAHHLELAEDVVQDALLEAIKIWNYQGLPENPTAWLYKVAKNKALNIVDREKYQKEYSAEVSHFLKSEWTANAAVENLFFETEIHDDQLRMMFTCCHPSISGDSQVSLTLKTLCGFSIPEIARAFLTTDENINRRLKRARQTIRENSIAFEVPEGINLEVRLDAVIQTIYLLFNEGYSASKGNDLIRYELCGEAIRLAELLADSMVIKEKSNVFAILALMYLNSSRFQSRQNEKGDIITMAEQDRTQWDKNLMQKGFYYLDQSTNATISVYHVLATISAYHCSAADFESTDWTSILALYDKLLLIDPSPLVMLNRAIAFAKVNGEKKAIEELKRIEKNPALQSYHLFHSTLAEFYLQSNLFQEAGSSLKKAIDLSSLSIEKEWLQKKLELCLQKIN
ncbi:MAG: sigma-70 family RNA polymerase sigma factor [Saprospiraceae bacterium]